MKRFHKVLVISSVIVIFITLMDINGFHMWQQLGGFAGEAYSKANEAYLKLFWQFAYGLIAIAGIVYWIMRKDISETIAIVTLPIILLQFGLEDLLYYKLQGLQLDASMPWLMDSLGTGNVAKLMGLATVTATSLIVSVIAGIAVSYFMIKWLEKKKW